MEYFFFFVDPQWMECSKSRERKELLLAAKICSWTQRIALGSEELLLAAKCKSLAELEERKWIDGVFNLCFLTFIPF